MKTSNISYFLFKPDAEKKFGEMKEIIEEKFPSVLYFAVPDWNSTIKKLYKKHYDTKGDSFSDMYEPFLASINELYGNYGIIAIVHDKNISEEDLVKKVYLTKQLIRNKFCKPSAFGIVSNTGELPNVKQKRRIKNNIKIVDFEGTEKKLKHMSKVGEYRLHFLNYIHSPDNDVGENSKEIGILVSSGLLKKEMLMSASDILVASELKTFEIVKKYVSKGQKDFER